jgi:hypothetical protein
MLNFEASTRRGLTWLIAAVLSVLVAGSPLSACPFMQSEKMQADMPCCPRKPVPAKHCPVSSDLQVCPLYTTEGKIAIAKDKFEIAKLSVSPAPVLYPIWLQARSSNEVPEAVTPVDLYLVNRVLRI